MRSQSKAATGSKLAKRLDAEGLLAYAARVLAARTQTVSELRRKLVRRAAQAGDVEETIRRLKENGYLNDQRFAESFATWRKENEGFGKARVIRDLVARKVALETAKRAAEKTYSSADELEMIGRFLARKYRGKDLTQLFREEKHLASAYRRLRYAGFSSANSVRALKGYAVETGNLDAIETNDNE